MEDKAHDALVDVEAGLDVLHPERSRVPVRVLGYGEMSTVLTSDAAGLAGQALKRMAIFHDESEAATYARNLDRYAIALRAAGLELPPQRAEVVTSPRTGWPVLYLMQSRVPAVSVANAVLHSVDDESALRLVRSVLRRACEVVGEHDGGVRLALDSQISNWSVDGFDPGRAGFVGDEGLVYLDTGTPLLRIDGVEQIDPELFLRLCPSSLRWLVRRFFLDEVLDRFYDPRLVAVDLLGNLCKEGRPDLVESGARVATEVLGEGGAGAPVTAAEVIGFYRRDKFIWRLFLGLRRGERLLQTRVLRRPYDVVLPGRIHR